MKTTTSSIYVLIFSFVSALLLLGVLVLWTKLTIDVNNKLLSMLDVTIRLLLTYLSVLFYRKRVLSNSIGFEQAFLFGVACTISITVLVELFIYAYFSSLDTATYYGTCAHLFISIGVWSALIGPFSSFIFAVILMNKRSKVKFRRRKRQFQHKIEKEPSLLEVVQLRKNKNKE